MQPDELPKLVQRFFAHYLTAQRNLSPHTRSGYGDAFRLFLAFLSQHHRRPIDQLTLDTINPTTVLAFLDHLESTRGNAARTRNLRLAAIRTFVRFVLGQDVGLEFLGIGQRILAIPQKKSPKKVLGFLTRERSTPCSPPPIPTLIPASATDCCSPFSTTLALGFQKPSSFDRKICSTVPSIFEGKAARREQCRCGLRRSDSFANGAKPTASQPTN